MTKRDEAVFVKAFEEMEAEGCFNELRAKAKSKSHIKPTAKAAPVISKIGRKPHQQKVSASVSSRNAAHRTPLAASKK
jgi:hypothetical protein